MTKRIYDIVPVPKPRMTKSDKWKTRPATARYWAYKDECRLKGVELALNGDHITFIMPMPKSWSKKKKLEYEWQPHQQKPDWDNLAKGLYDAVYDEDSLVWDARVTKLWGKEGQIIIEGME